jgi:hypothetical protein
MPRTTALFLGLVLFTAGALKGLGVADWTSGADGAIFGSRWLAIGASTAELALGLWLILGFSPNPARLAALGAFLFLACVAASKGFHGDKFCACFGNLVEINPWLAFGFDLVAAFSLWWWRPEFVAPPPANSRTTGLAFFALSGFALSISALGAVKLANNLLPNAIPVRDALPVSQKHSVGRRLCPWRGTNWGIGRSAP